MTDALPAPLTPLDCDLQDFKFMPLDVARLRDSDLASDETPEACWAAVMLWCASWHQIPAASIPDNDQWLAKHAGYAQRGKVAKEWPDVKTGALRGWVKCSDGRLYHPVVAEKAIEAWEAKQDQRWRTECGRIKKHNERHQMSLPRPTFDEWMSLGCPSGHRLPVPSDIPNLSQRQGQSVTGETPSKRQGEGQRQGQGQIKKRAKALSSPAKLPTCPYDAIVSLYHEMLPEFTGCRVMDADRKKLIHDRWEWVLTTNKPDGTKRAESADQAMEWFRTYFELARANDFLMGRVPRDEKHKNWKPDIEYLMKSSGLKQVIEKTMTEPA